MGAVEQIEKGHRANLLVYRYLTATDPNARWAAQQNLVAHLAVIMDREKLFLPGDRLGLLPGVHTTINGDDAEDDTATWEEEGEQTRWFIEDTILDWLSQWSAKSQEEIDQEAIKGYFQCIVDIVKNKLIDQLRHEGSDKVGHVLEKIDPDTGKTIFYEPEFESLNEQAFQDDDEDEDAEEMIDQLPADESGQKHVYGSGQAKRGNRRQGPYPGGSPLAGQTLQGLLPPITRGFLRSTGELRQLFLCGDVDERIWFFLHASIRQIEKVQRIAKTQLCPVSLTGTWPEPGTDTVRMPASLGAPKFLYYWPGSKRYAVKMVPCPPTIYTSLESLRDWRGRLPKAVVEWQPGCKNRHTYSLGPTIRKTDVPTNLSIWFASGTVSDPQPMVWRYALVHRHTGSSPYRELELRRGYLWLTLAHVKPQKLRGSDWPPFPANPVIRQKLKLAEQNAKEEAMLDIPYSKERFVPKPPRGRPASSLRWCPWCFGNSPRCLEGLYRGLVCNGWFDQNEFRDIGAGVQPHNYGYVLFRIGVLQDRYRMPYGRALLKVLTNPVCACGGCAGLGTELEQDQKWEEKHGAFRPAEQPHSYESYVLFCARVDVAPCSEDLWRLLSGRLRSRSYARGSEQADSTAGQRKDYAIA